MNKIVSASEFKAKCLRLIDEMQKDGQPVTITKRGKVVAELMPSADRAEPLRPVFGLMAGTFVMNDDRTEPVDPDWEEKWGRKWGERGFPVVPRKHD